MGRHAYNYFTEPKLRLAVRYVRCGLSYHKAFLKTGIAPTTIKKYYLKYKCVQSSSKTQFTRDKAVVNHNVKQIFTPGQEITLIECFKNAQSLFYGLSEKECRMLAYQMIVKEDLKIPDGWKNGMAGIDWLTSFKRRNPLLKFDRPLRCNRWFGTGRTITWEKKNVSKFYDDLEKLIQEVPAFKDGTRIFSLDETYTSIDPKDKVAYREDSKSDLITTCCIVSASGASLPPVIIKPHKILLHNDSSEIPPGTMTLTALHGRMTTNLFAEAMCHFINHSNSSLENPCILIMDIDICHLSSAAFDFAKSSGVHLLTLHSHISKHLQPLEVGLFSSFQKYYYAGMDKWLAERSSSNKTDEINSFDFSTIVGEAYVKTMTPENIQKAFKKCGILPFDRDLFSDSYFLSCVVRDQPCFDCKSRDDRIKKPTVQKPIHVFNEKAGEKSKDLKVNEPETAAGSSNSRPSLKTKQATQRDRRAEAWRKKSNPDLPSSRIEMSQQKRGTELDKLKRRMIRTVARLLKEKKTEEEVWEELKKESGSNCKKLWERMRSLTLKKLKRLLDAEDRIEYVPAVARMTLTDWLLYDLVIVHEKIDVIDRHQKKDSKVLTNLFSLVQRFMIEGRSGDDLAEAWTAATVSYNSKGHQCSPMLMQRRWYQIKELTRHKLYKFWFCYRGNERLLQIAKQDQPTELQRAIALRYPDIITKPFPEWEERIEMKLVVMPEEFEVKMRKKTLMKPSDESAPDVVIVERKIDTITLGDSDSDYNDEENSRESNATPQNSDMNSEKDEASQTPVIVNVKTEPQDVYDNIETTEHSPYQPDEPKDRFQEEIERLTLEEDKILTDSINNTEIETSQVEIKNEECTMPVITNVMGAVDAKIGNIQNDVTVGNERLEITDKHSNEHSYTVKKETTENDELLDIEESVTVNNNYVEPIETETEKATHKGETIDSKELEFLENNFDAQSQESIVIDDDDDEIIPSKDVDQENNCQVTNEIGNAVFGISSLELNQTRDVPMDRNDAITINNDNLVPVVDQIAIDEPTENEIFCPIITAVADGSHFKTEMEIDTRDSHEPEDGEENVDENISLQDFESRTEENTIKMEPGVERHSIIDFTDEIISELNFAEDGIEFADDGIEYTEGDRNELNESQVVRQNTNIANENEDNPKFDLKLLMNPVVFTTKLDEMIVYKCRSLSDPINEKELIDKIFLESKPISTKSIKVEQVEVEDSNINEFNDDVQVKVENQEANEVDDDLFHNDSSDESENDDIDESKKVKVSSNILQKPRIRSYHPIQLCKNPDFNTRLKRLTVGFFSSSRNRAFLKACKPMTIDVSKTFESKLVDGTMYLKPSDQVIKKEIENITESAVSILPSAVAVQSLMDNETADADKILQEELKKRMLERNKIINLPNISVVRQINQHLLMAEVAPIMAHIEKSSAGHSENIPQNIKPVEEPNVKTFNSGANALKLNPDVNVTENSKCMNDNELKNSLLIASYESPVSVETPINSNEIKKSMDETPSNVIIQPVLVPDNSDNNKSKVDKALEKQKKRQERQKNMPSWITKNSYYDDSKSDSLLTIDTLYKMLHALDPSSVQPLPVKSKQKKGQKNRPVNNLPSECNDNETDKQRAVTTKAKITIEPVLVYSTEYKSKKQKYCCWAKMKIIKMSGPFPNLRLMKHRCPTGNCRCCCKELLRQREIDAEVKILEGMQNSSDNLTEAIEHVVQQSRDLSHVSDPQIHIVNVETKAVGKNSQSSVKISVGLQANMDEDDSVQITNSEPDVSVTEKQVEDEITIDLDAEEVNVLPLTETQSPKPKIRVRSALQVQRNNIPPPQRKRKTRIQPITMTPTLSTVTPPSLPKPPTLAPKVNPGKYNFYSKYGEEVPCSCRPNVGVDKSAAMLIVDGSNDCLRHTKSRVSKETRIYLNRKHMSASERPFYVGKNKILLTNVKEPKAQLPEQAAITLPDGVQVVLLPDGTITYLVNPGVELTPLQIAAMPVILSSIKAQINASGITLPVPDVSLQENVVNLDKNAVPESVSTTDVQNLENSNVEGELNKANGEICSIAPLDSVQIAKDDSVTTSRVGDQSDSQSDVNQNSHSNKTDTIFEVIQNSTGDQEIKLSVNEMPVNINNNATDATDTEKTASFTEAASTENMEEPAIARNEHDAQKSSETIESNNVATSSSRNLLSDLMEMSGIHEEDVVPVQQEHSITTPPESVMQPMTLQIPELSLSQPSLIPVPALSPLEKNKHSITAQINEKVHDLNPITSFSELKYACDNDGLFFKLDLSNGIIVPINVCIQKNPSESATFKTNIGPTEVIDLTDEQGNSINEESNMDVFPIISSYTKRSKIMPRKLSSMLPVISPPGKNNTSSPLNLNDTTAASAIIHKKQALLKSLSNNLKSLKILEKRQNINILRKSLLIKGNDGLLKRKLNLGKVEAKIDLVDSDAPMEEEYLVEDSSEDSDDEPLAKIAKKMRSIDDNGHLESDRGSQNEVSQDGSIIQGETALPDENIDFEEAIDAIEPAPLHPVNSDIIEPVPTQLVLTGAALNQRIVLPDSFLASNDADDEDSQEDCILGV